MKMSKVLLSSVMVAMALPQFALANLNGPYTPDANTLFLMHFDEAAGGSVTTNNGSVAGNFYTVTNTTAGIGLASPPPVTTMLGYSSYAGFGNAMSATNTDFPYTNGLAGFDGNKNNAYDADVQPTPAHPSVDAIALSTLNIGNGGASPFTIEALVCPSAINRNQEILCTDDYNGSRGFQFKITNVGQLQFQMITAPTVNLTVNIPTTGFNAFVPNTWYHVAVTYDGTTMRLYWTKLDPSVSAANQIGSIAWTATTASGAIVAPLIIGGENRGSDQETVMGLIDEMRISSVARAANQMQFFSPTVTISQNPVSQNIDYGQPVTLNVTATSLSQLGYQWRFNSNSIPGATTNTYSLPSVSAANAGYYDVVVTNVSGNAATSAPALLVVGAANFLAHRWGFTNDLSDSIGGAWGTNFGNATVSGGQLVLDGSAGTYAQLPASLLNNLTAVTLDFWATYGTSVTNSHVFDFGNTNFSYLGNPGYAENFVYFSPHTSGNTHQLGVSGGSFQFEQDLAMAGNLDGGTVHVTCVIDPPNQQMSIYTNGVLESVNTNLLISLASINDQTSYLGRSLNALITGEEYLNASIDEFRIFNGALAPSSVLIDNAAGPNATISDGPVQFLVSPSSTSVPQNQTVTFTSLAEGRPPIVYQWYKNNVPIAGATNSSYSYAPTFADNNASFKVLATNTFLSTVYSAASTPATLTVAIPETLTWLGGADDLWNFTSLDWSNSIAHVVAYAQFDSATFNDAGAGQPNVDLQQPLALPNLTVSNNAANYLFTSSGQNGSLAVSGNILKAGTGTLTIDVTNNSTAPTVVQNGTLQIGNSDSFGTLGSGAITNNGTLVLSRADTILAVPNPIHGTGSIDFNGTGATTVSGTNDYSGPTFLNAGIVFLTTSTGFGATSSTTTVASGAQLYITANVNFGVKPLTLNGTGAAGSGALRKGAGGASTYSGPVSLASDSTIGIDSGATLTVSNQISGSAVLTASGSGTLTLSSNATINGFILNGPVVNVNSAQALGTQPVTVNGNGRFVIGTGLTVANEFDANVVSPGAATGLLMTGDNTNGTVTTLTGPITFGEAALTGGNFAGPTTSGYLNVLGSVSAPGIVTSVRLGNVRFSGGGDCLELQVRANSTSIGANDGVPTDAVMDIGGNGSPTAPTFFNLNGFNQKLAGLKNTVTAANLGMVTNSGGSVNTLTLDPAGNAYSFNGGIVGPISLVLNSGLQTFTGTLGTNAYTGNTTVNGGTLELANATLAAASTVTIASGAILQLDFSATNKIAALVLNGASQPNGLYNSTTSPAFISGPGILLVTPAVNTTPTNVTMTVTGTNIVLSWPTDHAGWQLQVQTNTLAKGLSTNWSIVPNSANVTAVTNAIIPANGAVYYRMYYLPQ